MVCDWSQKAATNSEINNKQKNKLNDEIDQLISRLQVLRL